MPTYLDIFGNYFTEGYDTLTQDDVRMNPQEMDSFRRIAEIATSKPLGQRGSVVASDYLQDPKNPDSVDPRLKDVNLSIGRTGSDPRYGGVGTNSYIRREGNNWRVKDYYDWNPNNRTRANGSRETNIQAASRLIGDGIRERNVSRFKEALNPISRQIKGDNHGFQTDFTVPLSEEQLKRLGSNEMVMGGQKYYYEPYQFAQGETVEQAIQKQFAGNKYKPEGENLANYKRMIEQRNKSRNPGDTAFYMPSLPEQVRSPAPQLNLQKRAIKFLNESLAPIMKNPAGY